MGLKNFISGMASTLCIFPQPIRLEDFLQHYSEDLTPQQRDAKAIENDWKKVGQYINNAMEQFGIDYIK